MLIFGQICCLSLTLLAFLASLCLLWGRILLHRAWKWLLSAKNDPIALPSGRGRTRWDCFQGKNSKRRKLPIWKQTCWLRGLRQVEALLWATCSQLLQLSVDTIRRKTLLLLERVRGSECHWQSTARTTCSLLGLPTMSSVPWITDRCHRTCKFPLLP